MKILYNIAGTWHSGGMERVLANKANWLVANGYEVIIVTTDQRGNCPFFPLDNRIKCIDLGINYEENNGKSIWNKIIHYPFKQYKHRRSLEIVLKEECPDVTVSMFCNDVSFITKLKDGSKKVLEIHFSKFKRLQYGRKGIWRLVDLLRSRNDERLVKKFDKFVVLTNEDKEYWGNIPNIEVVYNARTYAPKDSASLENKKVIAVGRYTHQKGFNYLIDAWSIVAKKRTDWHLDIVGDGEERAQMVEHIAKLGLENQVTLVPPTNDMISVYKDASIVAMTSRYEGLPMVLLESQAFGLPIVSFSCKCGPKDIVKNGENGFLVPEGDTEEFASCLLRIMEDDELRMRMGQSAKCDSVNFAESIIMEKWRCLFSTITKI